eukprot:198487_1
MKIYVLLLYIVLCYIQINNSKFVSHGRSKERLKHKKLLARGARNRNGGATSNLLRKHARKFGDFDINQFKKADNRFRKSRSGKQRYRTKQFYNGIPVFGTSMVIEENDQNGEQSPILGKYYDKTDIESSIVDINPTITEQEAFNLALQATPGISYEIKRYKAELYVYHYQNEPVLCWFISFSTQIVIVNAYDGTILAQQTRARDLESIKACGNGGNGKIGKQEYCMEINEIPFLENSYIKIMDNKNHNERDFAAAIPVECEYINTIDSSGMNVNKCIIEDLQVNGGYCVACDVYRNLNYVFEIFNEWLDGTIPIKEEYLPLPVYIHVQKDGASMINAGWVATDEGAYMQFGDGGINGGWSYYPFSVLDVAAHELGHGFTEREGGLVYDEQSGGMNEAFSDLIGVVAKYKATGNVSWDIGCGLYKYSDKCLRYLYYPPKDDISIENYKKDYYDGMNPHYSSGPYNKAWYLLNTKYEWPIQQIFSVVSKAQMYWNEKSTMDQGVCGIYEALYEIFGNNTETDKIADTLEAAFVEVGIQCLYYPELDEIDITKDIKHLSINTEVTISGEKRSWQYFYFDTDDFLPFLSDEPSMIIVSITGINDAASDADLYISKDNIIPSEEFHCQANSVGNNDECQIDIADRDYNKYYILIYGWNAYENVKLKYTVKPYEISKIELGEIYNISGVGQSKQYFYFELDQTVTISMLEMRLYGGEKKGESKAKCDRVYTILQYSKLPTWEVNMYNKYNYPHWGAEKSTDGWETYIELPVEHKERKEHYYLLIEAESSFNNMQLKVSSVELLAPIELNNVYDVNGEGTSMILSSYYLEDISNEITDMSVLELTFSDVTNGAAIQMIVGLSDGPINLGDESASDEPIEHVCDHSEDNKQIQCIVTDPKPFVGIVLQSNVGFNGKLTANLKKEEAKAETKYESIGRDKNIEKEINKENVVNTLNHPSENIIFGLNINGILLVLIFLALIVLIIFQIKKSDNNKKKK